jgi:hypothetical protein
MELHHYSYRFVQKVEEYEFSENSFLQYKMLYTFRSPKSHQWYWVWVEVYDDDFYAVKFHLKAHRYSADKYNLMTGLNEARPVINTCITIMCEIGKKNPHASFGFIGANMHDESTYSTKRFRIYSTMMATYFAKNVFSHYVLIDKSAYLLIRKAELELHPELLTKLNVKFKQMYNYFD